MTVRLRNGGSWYAVPNGKLRIRYAGSWYSARKVYVKIGAVGSGYWYDSGYVGLPSTPTGVEVYEWNYSVCKVKWNAGAGGAPIAHYRVYIVKQGYGAIVDTTTTNLTYEFGVNWDSTYLFYVQAVAVNGLETGWADNNGSTIYGRIGIGHPQQDTYGYVHHVDAWNSGNLVWSNPARDYLFRDEAFSVYVPNNYVVKSVAWGDLRVHTGYLGDIVTTGFDRTVQLLFAGVWQGWGLDDGIQFNEGLGDINIMSSGAYAWYGLPINPPGGLNGGNNWWGLGPRGGGWVTAADGRVQYSMYASSVNFTGDYHHDDYELTNRIYAQGNYYW
jgi:hypothetical protein